MSSAFDRNAYFEHLIVALAVSNSVLHYVSWAKKFDHLYFIVVESTVVSSFFTKNFPRVSALFDFSGSGNFLV